MIDNMKYFVKCKILTSVWGTAQASPTLEVEEKTS